MLGQIELQERTSENLIFSETTNKTNSIKPVAVSVYEVH